MVAWCDNGIRVVLIIEPLSVKYASIYGERICMLFALKCYKKNKNKRAGWITNETRPAKY